MDAQIDLEQLNRQGVCQPPDEVIWEAGCMSVSERRVGMCVPGVVAEIDREQLRQKICQSSNRVYPWGAEFMSVGEGR